MNKLIKSFSVTIAVMLLSVAANSQTVQVSADNEKSSEVIVFGNNFQAKIAGEQVSYQFPGGITEDTCIQWDDGTNTGSCIGPANGAVWYCASRWLPSDLTPYDGLYMTSITFFPVDFAIATYTLKVWTGENAETEILSQELPGLVFDFFNEIPLDNPVQIDASLELWFGLKIYQNAGGMSVGCDYGPAVQEFGDMMSDDGAVTWNAMSSLGFDYNWNLSACLSETVGGNELDVIGKNEIVVFPNPANDVINISASINIRSITVFNSIGQVISVENVESNIYKINTSDFDNGMYFLQMETEEGVITKCIIIE